MSLCKSAPGSLLGAFPLPVRPLSPRFPPRFSGCVEHLVPVMKCSWPSKHLNLIASSNNWNSKRTLNPQQTAPFWCRLKGHLKNEVQVHSELAFIRNWSSFLLHLVAHSMHSFGSKGFPVESKWLWCHTVSRRSGYDVTLGQDNQGTFAHNGFVALMAKRWSPCFAVHFQRCMHEKNILY